uniref:Uncharacterized protein n=1 Tax=Pithovirus LCPAC406 TaxID=2506599 RepID=A0A481ZE49_9VIRU|nr:MAG: uncharacterized protein LCPAC406_03610 [Pithovirus LCPAC406]
MTTLVCMANCDPIIGMWYILPKHALIFLDKKHSSLIFRIGKDSGQYEELFSRLTKSRITKHIELDVYQLRYPYNREGDYFVIDSRIHGLEWRTHPDLISYVKETDQTTYKIIDIPEGKTLTEFSIEDGVFGMIVSDGPAKLV